MNKLEQLKLSCPFTWDLQELIQHRVAMSATDIEEFELYGVPEITFIIRIIRIFRSALTNDNVDDLMRLAERALEILCREEETLYMGRPALHILSATQLYFYEARDYRNELEIGLSNLDLWPHDFTKLNESEQAAIDGFKSFTISLFPLNRVEEGIALVKRAVAAHPTNALWHFVFGHFLRKTRRNRSHRSTPCSLELSCFANAAKYSDNPCYHVYAIQSRHETMFDNRKQVLPWEAYAEMIPRCNHSSVLLLKLALGLIRCNRASVLHIVLKILDRVEEMSPNNPTSLHYRSMAYRNLGNQQLQYHFLQLAANTDNYVAADIYLKHLANTGKINEAIEFALSMLKRFENCSPVRVQNMPLNLAILHYINHDYKSSAKYFLETIKICPNSKSLSEPYDFSRNIKIGSVYKYLRSTFLPPISIEITTDCEFFVALQELKRYCDLDIQRRMFVHPLKNENEKH